MIGTLRLFHWFTLRHLRSNWARTGAVLLGIALGAAVFTSVRLAVHATLDSFTRSMDLIAGDSDLTLVRAGGRVPDRLVAALMTHPAVRTASRGIVRLCAAGRPGNPFFADRHRPHTGS